MSSFKKSVEGTTLHFALEGVITANNAPRLWDEVNESIEGMKDVVFDLAGLRYISSAGLRVLLGTQKLLGDRGDVYIRNASSEVRDVLHMTKISMFLLVEED